jgi:hypothetical protein
MPGTLFVRDRRIWHVNPTGDIEGVVLLLFTAILKREAIKNPKRQRVLTSLVAAPVLRF